MDNLEQLSKVLSDQLERLNDETRTDDQRAKDIQIAAQVKNISACIIQNEALKHSIKSELKPAPEPLSAPKPATKPAPKSVQKSANQLTPRAQMRRHNER